MWRAARNVAARRVSARRARVCTRTVNATRARACRRLNSTQPGRAGTSGSSRRMTRWLSASSKPWLLGVVGKRRACKQPTGKAPATSWLSVVDVGIALADVDRMQPAHARVVVALQLICEREAELLGKIGGEDLRHRSRLVEVGAEQAHRGEL